MDRLVRLRAILWLHSTRLWRYRWSFLNMILSETAWIFLLVLGVLLFVPRGEVEAAVRAAFWVIVSWTLVSQFSSLVGGWTTFFISMGMVEEHILRGVSPFRAILGRVITGLSVAAASLLFMGAVLGETFGVDLFALRDPAALAVGLAAVGVEGLSYGLMVSSISFRTSVPQNLLEILNFSVIGLMMVPVDSLDGWARAALLAVPYVAPTHLLKVGAGAAAGALAAPALASSLIEAAAMAAAALLATGWAEEWVRRNGVRAVGFW